MWHGCRRGWAAPFGKTIGACPVVRPREPVGPPEGVAPMSPELVCVIVSFLAALAGLLAGYGVARVQDRFRLTSAQARVKEITDQARKEADHILKESELKAKDELFR